MELCSSSGTVAVEQELERLESERELERLESERELERPESEQDPRAHETHAPTIR